MDARQVDPEHESTAWTTAAQRKAWNAEKAVAAPWWAENSKEVYANGIDDLVEALNNWKSSKAGKRKGRKVRFPRFASRRTDHGRARFTTGAMRLEADRRTITLPVIGGLRSKENTRRVQRHVASGRARILNLTLSERWGRLFVSVCYAMRQPTTARVPRFPGLTAGVDLGMRTLATVATTDPVSGAPLILQFPNPAPLRATLNARRRAGRAMSRRLPGSNGYRSAKAKLTAMNRRAVHLPREAAHQLTPELAATYGTVVIEDLDIAAMKKSMGRRAFRRAVSDAAMGQIRPLLGYKTTKFGSALVVADRWYPSSQLHHQHYLPDGTQCRLVGKNKMDKTLLCPTLGMQVDRDFNAADNLRDWPGHASRGAVRAPVLPASNPAEAAGTADQLVAYKRRVW